jgi:hypothetical protein
LAQLGRGREKTRRLSNMTAAAEWVTAYWEIGINGIQCCAQEEKLWYTLMRDRWWGIPLCNHDRGLIIHKWRTSNPLGSILWRDSPETSFLWTAG